MPLPRFIPSYTLLLALTFTFHSSAFAQTPSRIPTIDQSLEMHTVSSPQISPDGKHLTYEQSRTDWEANAFQTDLWIADTATGETHPLTTMGNPGSSGAQWSPDGHWIAFLSGRPGTLHDSPKDKRQIWILPVIGLGGEAQQLTRMEQGVDGFDWAPDSKRIAFTAESPETKAMKDRKESFGDYQVVHADYEMAHLWLIDLPKAEESGKITPPAEPKQVTKEDSFTIESFSFSPDGTRIAFSAQRDPDLISGFSADIYTVTLADGKVKRIVDTAGPDGNPHWSPDGTEIAYTTANAAKYFYYADQRIAVVPSTGGTPRVLTLNFDEDPDILDWSPEGIYFSALQKTQSSLFLLDPKTSAVTKLDMPGSEIAGQFSFSKDFKQLAFRGTGANKYPEIYATTLPISAPKQITHAAEQLSDFNTAHREVVQWKSGDGTVVEGVLIKPANFDAKKKYPLLVVIHGGPTGIDMPMIAPDRYYPIERFIAKGALILKPNYRGSAGYGEKFRSLNVRNLGVGDYADVISGVDSLIAQGFVDKDRVGSMGWSEGGYISAFITTSSDRFKAVSVGAGISDWATYYYNTDITPFAPQYLHATPSDDPAIYAKTSPITYIAKAKTPTLIQHGGSDHRVPIANGYELRQALEDHNVPVKMVIYDGFGHPINKPKQQRAVMEENENWFNHYIFGDPLAPALTPTVKAKPEKP
jgi:dipeptidyl aminopeptidase/acylaminoacyl peptidase